MSMIYTKHGCEFVEAQTTPHAAIVHRCPECVEQARRKVEAERANVARSDRHTTKHLFAGLH